jgi:hypothetical protein
LVIHPHGLRWTLALRGGGDSLKGNLAFADEVPDAPERRDLIVGSAREESSDLHPALVPLLAQEVLRDADRKVEVGEESGPGEGCGDSLAAGGVR